MAVKPIYCLLIQPVCGDRDWRSMLTKIFGPTKTSLIIVITPKIVHTLMQLTKE